MKKQDIQKVFKYYGITLKEVKEHYNYAVRDAKRFWKEGCIEEDTDTGIGLGRLYAQIGYSHIYGLMDRAGWHYSHMRGDSTNWYNAPQVYILNEDEDYQAADAFEWLEDDNYYQRTGKISKRALQGYADEYPLEFKTFEEVVVELAQELARHIKSY